MEDIKITTYGGNGIVSGETTLISDMSNISNERCGRKKFPFRTLTTNYREARTETDFVRYNPVVVLSINVLNATLLTHLRPIINADPNTLGSFYASRRQCLYVLVYLNTPYGHLLREIDFSVPVLSYQDLEEHHVRMHEAARAHMEGLAGVPITCEGAELNEGFMLANDEQAYFNKRLLRTIQEVKTPIISMTGVA